MELPSFQPTLLERIFIKLFHLINLFVPWHKLPGFIGASNLDFLRIELRANNLHDGYASGSQQGNTIGEPMKDHRFLNARNSDGKFNSLELPLMACSGMRFGRNFPRKYTQKPTEEELWTCRVEAVIGIADFWYQSNEVYDIPIPPGDAWPNGYMPLPRTKPDETLDPSDIKCPGYKNTNTAWWDGSQIYGSSETVTQSLRTTNPDGKLMITKGGREAFLPRDSDGNPKTGFNNNWWIGMEMLHTLFVLEHNSIDMLRKAYPDWAGDEIFDKARLINSALMAKIHTVEWTPAILAHPALQIGMAANWWGIAGEALNKIVGRISKSSDAISGIPGSGVDHFGVPYSLTEEFVSVYRMHSLIPDDIAFFNATNGKHQSTIAFEDVAFNKVQKPLNSSLSFADTFYSFSINYSGAITNFNYPNFLRHLTTPDGQVRDMGTVDILRDRERGEPVPTAPAYASTKNLRGADGW
ncbi:related to fatty acid alpha-oxidase [Phialocephala subalpina]|uniref:Related to fatty acid alpha-oxidase n=1 Tax=Phialocephala subalpina TaxID=576137 RepID=A0A1L7XC50_9HELO|nr:related to fatty acid alpha-oxidase [Phialocephala subalpina]